MGYGAMREAGYEARLVEQQKGQAERAEVARQHVIAALRGAQAQEAVNPLLGRLVAALERIAAAQERLAAGAAGPDVPQGPG